MAWNKPSTEDQQKKPTAKAPSLKRGVIVGAIAVAIGAMCIWMFSGGEDAPKANPVKDRGLIKEVKPAPAPKTNEAVVAAQPELSPRERQLKAIRDKYGSNIPENLKPTVYYLENPPKTQYHTMKTRASIFECPSDRKIASLLLVKPGSAMLRCPRYDESFDDQFRDSLLKKIKITDEDTPEDKELKQAVFDTRIDLYERMKKGEKPSEIMRNEAEALYALGQFKSDLAKEFAKIEGDETVSDEDLKDFAEAANIMLSQKGLPGFESPDLLMRQVHLEMSARQRAEQAKQKGKTK